MNNSILLFLSVLLIGSSCNTSLNKIFKKQSPHEAYAEAVKNDSLGKQWVEVSKKALTAPQTLALPYKLAGYFHADKPRALALQFSARRGERINFELSKKQGENFTLFADLYKKNGTDISHMLAADTASSQFGFDVEETTDYILRLQPGLYHTGEYSLSAGIAPSLGFPVAGNKARPGSYWGDARDGGKRSHEGIDIFAAKKTPAIAAADGFITGVREGGIGGKTVWLRVDNRDIHLYYAHLDQQLVQEGQSVKKGDTLGLVGNTGNAKYTPPHLHFGVYTYQGPIDPLPFVNKKLKTAPAVTAKNLDGFLKLKTRARTKQVNLEPESIIVPLAFTNKGYIGELADGSQVQLASKDVIPFKPEGVLAKEKTNASRTGG